MISILISAYETEDYIVECIKAFNNQSYFKNNPNYEILIGVDGCKKTLEELKKHLKDFKNVRVFWTNVNQGTYKMFNRLMDISTGSKILRFDSDDLPSVEMIEKLELYIKEYDVVRMNYLSDSGKSEFPSFGQIYFKRGLIHHFGGCQDWPVSADRELLERLSPNFKIGIIDEPIFYKRDRPNSLTRNDNTGYDSSLREEYKSIIDNSNIKELYVKPIKTPVTEIHAFNINDVSDFFKKRHGDYFDFINPRTFTEKTVWRKLFEKDPLFITLSDKHTMRDYVNKFGLSDLLVELLNVIEFDDFAIDSLLDLPDCVIKASHGYNMQIFKKSGVFYDIKNKVMTNDDVINTISNWKTYKHGNTDNYLYEWSYSNIIKPVIIVEPFIEDIIDINLQCFNGEVTYIFVSKDKFANIKEAYYDKNWNLLGDINTKQAVRLPKLIKPSYLDELINVTEKLSENIGYCRVDFLCTENSFKLNEISLYNASGLSKKRDYKYDLYLGEKWPIRLNAYNISDEPNIKSYCINLVNKHHKFEKIKSELSKINIFLNRFVVEKHRLTKRILREGVNEKSNQILESHLKLLKHLESIDQPCFIIFEDDIKVIRDIDVDEIISSAPKDWDVIYLGGMNHYHTPKIIDHKFYKCKFSFNAHAFIVKKEFIPKMIEHLEKRECENDVIFAYMQYNSIGNWYGLIEDAIIQDGVDNPTFITTYKKNTKLINLNDVKEIKLHNKIFQIGFNKCGTTSLHQMFIDSGLKSIHWDGGNIAKKIHSNIKQNKAPLDGVDKYDCYTDIENIDTNSFPLIDYYELLDKAYPNSLFILNTRPLDNWIKSRLNHQSGSYANTFKNVLGVKTDEELITIWREQWTEHHNKAIDYFKNSDNFIIFDIETEGDKLTEFLRSWSIPVTKFPHLYKS
jgi:hypothetical protein